MNSETNGVFPLIRMYSGFKLMKCSRVGSVVHGTPILSMRSMELSLSTGQQVDKNERGYGLVLADCVSSPAPFEIHLTTGSSADRVSETSESVVPLPQRTPPCTSRISFLSLQTHFQYSEQNHLTLTSQ